MAKKKKTPPPACASCGHEGVKKACVDENGLSSKGCPTIAYDNVFSEADKEYDRLEIREFARQASRQEADCYANRHERPYVMQPTKTRIVEIYEFAEKMQYRRLGLAFCLGLTKEAGIVEQILKDRGFEVVSVLCKAGRTSKDRIGIEDADKIYRGTDFPGQITKSRENRAQHSFRSVRGSRLHFFQICRGTDNGSGCKRPRDRPQSFGCDISF